MTQAADSQISRLLRLFSAGQAWDPILKAEWLNLYGQITQQVVNDLQNAYNAIAAHTTRDQAFVNDLHAYNDIMLNIIPANLIAGDGPININITAGGAVTANDIITLNDAFRDMLAKARAAAAGGGQPRNPAQSFQTIMGTLRAYIATQAISDNLINQRPGNVPRLQAMYASCNPADKIIIDNLANTIPNGWYRRQDVLDALQDPAPGPGLITTANLTQMCYQFNCMRICQMANLTRARATAAMQMISNATRHVPVTNNFFRLIAARNPDLAAIMGQLTLRNLNLHDHPHLLSIQRFVRGCTLLFEGVSHLSVLRINRPLADKLHLMSEILRLSPPSPNQGTTTQGEHMFHMYLVAQDNVQLFRVNITNALQDLHVVIV